MERESRQDEEKENHTQQLLREIADNQRSTVNRKVEDLYKVRPVEDNMALSCFKFTSIQVLSYTDTICPPT